MCGIAGAVVTEGTIPALSAVLDHMRHRGPDGIGEFRENGLWLGHSRLAIIDLTEAAGQPMTLSGCGTIVFNGEIYDHAEYRRELESAGEVFQTRSDTEVLLRILAKYGVSSLPRLHGMYAFAWWNPRGSRLVLARDHCGIKPLYVWRQPGKLAFASEVRTLGHLISTLGGPTRINAEAIAQFLAWGSVPEPLTILQGVEMLPVGEAWEIDVRSARRTSTTRVDRRTDEAASSGSDTSAVVEAVRAAVTRHVVSDQPVALFLSAGLDSGVLAAELARLPGARRHAISVRLGTQGTDDEPEIVERLARRLGLPLHSVDSAVLDGRLPQVLSAYDQPSIDGINTYLIAEAARALGYRVALSGLGADEVFGGYHHLRPTRLGRVQMGFARSLRACAPLMARTPDWRIRRLAMLSSAPRHEPAQRSWRRIMSDAEIRRLMPDVRISEPPPHPADHLKIEQQTYLRDTLLRDTDVLGMAHGVEIRPPYLDPAVLNVASAIGADRLTCLDRPSKWVLRDGWSNVLEPRTLGRPKTGFTLDFRSWLERSEEVLHEAIDRVRRSPLFDAKALGGWWTQSRRLLRTTHAASSTHTLLLLHVWNQLERWGDP